MEGGNNMGLGGGSSNSSRPTRTTSRYLSYSTSTTFSGPVRRWQKKWVHVSPSQPRSKPQSNVHKSSTSSPILLCKWTPLTPSPDNSSPIPRRKFRYTPITVFEQKKLTENAVTSKDNPERTHKTEERSALVSDYACGMLDMNSDLMAAHQENSEHRPFTHYSRRS